MVVGTFAILGSVLFRVREVTVKFTNDLVYYKSEDEERLLASIHSITHGKNSILGINRKKIERTLEQETRIRVTNIEVKFPNRIEIKVHERHPVYKLKTGDKWAVLCGHLRVLEVVNDAGALIDLSSDALSFNDLKERDFLAPDNGIVRVLYQLASIFTDATFKEFNGIKFNDGMDGIMLTLLKEPEFELVIHNAGSRLKDKFTLGWSMVKDGDDVVPGRHVVWDDLVYTLGERI